jgi:hypothetical protein
MGYTEIAGGTGKKGGQGMRTIGAKYEQVKNLPLKKIAALIRTELRAAKKEGAIPEEWDLMVRTRDGRAIDVTLFVPDNLNDLMYQFGETNRMTLRTGLAMGMLVGEYEPLATVKEVEEFAQGVVAQYNYDDCDPMTDYFNVNFYGFVNVRPMRYKQNYV